NNSESGKAVRQSVDQVAAFFQGLIGKAAEEVGNGLKFLNEAFFVVIFNHFSQAFVVLDKVKQQFATPFIGKDNISIEFSALGKNTSGHHQFTAIDGAGIVQDVAGIQIVGFHKRTVQQGYKVTKSLHQVHDMIMLLGIGLNDSHAPQTGLLNKPLLSFG